ncbi:VOC family protein [Flagellimonas olearia]|uniref:VOC family protein n=1 Tax=Flagellimonas olearia TaxID=552546 RepID=A0A6I1E306_9FLAO|nr:VOC family protein [Allomuricauda olearia]KAB7530235.1 VOC family protein [Allomuricauda olearia]
MKLNHFGITVTEVAAARIFLEKYFGMKGIGKNNHKITHLMDDSGTILSLFKETGNNISTPQTTHIGFIQESEDSVLKIYERLTKDGFVIKPPKRGHGLSFIVVAPGGFAVEVVC